MKQNKANDIRTPKAPVNRTPKPPPPFEKPQTIQAPIRGLFGGRGRWRTLDKTVREANAKPSAAPAAHQAQAIYYCELARRVPKNPKRSKHKKNHSEAKQTALERERNEHACLSCSNAEAR